MNSIKVSMLDAEPGDLVSVMMRISDSHDYIHCGIIVDVMYEKNTYLVNIDNTVREVSWTAVLKYKKI